jgi:hypothetical protein
MPDRSPAARDRRSRNDRRTFVRVLTALSVFTLLCGCTVLDTVELNAPSRLDPNRVYLGSSRVTNLGPTEMGRYACVDGPLICDQRGIGFDCRCF